jgi:beta-glucosidase
VVEAEGLYTGYKYYETRYADTVTGEGSNAKGTAGVTAVGATEWDYDKEVTYAFGYGLSYTKFTQELKGDPVVTHEGNTYTLDFTVTVTNEGTKAGKDVVEIYGQAPYTNGGLEKSAIQLLGFGKTKELAAGAHEDVTVHVDLQNLATYDMNHANSDSTKGGYVLEKGDYYFALGNGAHEALNNVLAKRGYSTVVGESKKVYMQTLTTDDYTTFAKSKSGAEVHNQLDYSDWNYYDDSNAVTYLSRSDWQTTYPKEYKDLTAPQKLIDDLNGTGENYYQYNANSTGADVTWGKEGDANLADMFQADWNDKRWDDLLDQVTLEEAVLMIMYGGPNLAGATSVGWSTGLYLTENSGSGIVITLGGTKDSDAPWAISSKDNNAGWSGGVFANAPTTAASYNPDLWHELGEFIGTESLFTGIPFLWGPGLNTHRASYNGRTGEYYSEDGVLAGNVAMEYAMGAMNYGLITAPKHFAFNDQETNRAGVSPFMTEQRARETELRAYQIAVEADKYDRLTNKDVGMRGLMTSFSKIGGVEVTCSYGLMTEILQNEWGFHGYAVTDIYDDTDMFVPVAASGVTCYDLRGMQPSMGVSLSSFANQSQGYTHAVETYAKDKTLQARMKLAVKNLLWVTAQSNMMNYISMNRQWRMTSWRATYIFVSIAAGVIAAGSVAMYVLTDLNVFKKKEEN